MSDYEPISLGGGTETTVEPKKYNTEALPLSLSGEPTPNQEEGPESLSLSIGKTVNTPNNMFDIDSILQEYGRPLIKEDFLKDDRLKELVYTSLEARMRPERFAGGARNLATTLSGGVSIDPRDYRSMEFEDVFEKWQNYQRSFAAGQTVTVGNELAYAIQADEETKAALGAGYTLFDNMDNAFTGEGSWAEMGDAIWDYTRAAVIDPTTLASLGIGKALSAGGTKAAAGAFRAVAKEAMKKGIKGKALGAAIKAAPYIAPDIAFNVGQDVAYQLTKMETDSQEGYMPFQTGLTAVGTVALPAIFAGTKAAASLRKSKLLKDSWIGYENLAGKIDDLPTEEAWKKAKEEIKLDTVVNAMDEQFGAIKGDFKKLLQWSVAKEQAAEVVGKQQKDFTDAEFTNLFKNFFMFPSENSKGFVLALRDAGFFPVRSLVPEGQPISSIYGQAIKFLDDDVVEKMVKDFEETIGRELNLGYTAEELSANFIRDASQAGSTLAISSRLARLEKAGLSGKEIAEVAGGKKASDAADPKRFQYGMSVYKRLLTSHLATTGANLRGFGQLVSLNTYADLVSSAAYASQSVLYKLAGDQTKSAFYGRRAAGSFKSVFRSAANMLTPDLTMDYADEVLSKNPEVVERLFRDIAGDGGVRDSLAHFNMDDAGLLWRGVDKVTKGAQTLTLVRMQDDLTKRWAFGKNLDAWILREYNETPQRFFSKSNIQMEMASPRFNDVIDRAVQDTLRETASVNWSTLPAKKAFTSARWWAGAVEFVTNKTPIGFVVPFGSFLNTTIATMGDLSGVNAFRSMYKHVTGKTIDYADDEFARLFGKAVAGWSLVFMGIPAAQERILNGLSWNTVEKDQGNLTDKQFDWPESTLRLTSTILAHALDGKKFTGDMSDFDLSKVPEKLMLELGLQLGGQAVRDLDDVKDTMFKTLAESVETGEFDVGALELLGGIASRVVQGVSRPLDPVNAVMALTSDENKNPDLKQGAKNYNQAIKYINHILPESLSNTDLPSRAYPTRGFDEEVTVGKQLLGNRVVKDPTIVDQMFNATGRPTWTAVQWQGPERIKNIMDGVIAGYLQKEAAIALKANKDYFKLPQKDKERILESVISKARTQTIDFMKNSPIQKTLEAARVLATQDKDKLRDVIEFLGYEGGLDELLEEEDALDILNKVKAIVDNYDEIRFNDLTIEK